MNGELFETLSASTQEALMRAGRPREFRPGEVVFHQGDPCDSLFLLRRGRVSVHVPTPEGDDVTIGLIAAPDAFGEVGLIRPDHHHTATVVALDDVHVLSVLATRFHDLRVDHPDLTDWLLLTLTHRLERMSELLADALFLDAEHRVARRLLDCRCSFGIEASEPLPLTQDDLAAMAGVSRPTANRVLRHLEDEGCVRLGRRHITIADLDSLARAAR
ncbi:MAG TPA: Crp/Fnr family transcriptional regulator [Candidatus Limnocylindrales bacterium]|nr:Crp/Fnr family transcriptional regulator [Candidatus Limnocylindrales bacterium]